jgi:hypothetical protein
MQAKQKGPKMELCLKSIHGISWKKHQQVPPTGSSSSDDDQLQNKQEKTNDDAFIPSWRVSVAFTGSSTSMEVSSATMCSRTGHLMIESLVMEVDHEEAEPSSEDPTTTTPLVARFQDPNQLRRIRQHRSSKSMDSSASSSSSRAPHLRMHLPPLDTTLPTMTLLEVNEKASSSSSSPSTTTKPELTNSSSHSTTYAWSPTGSVLPEEIELNISIRGEDSFIVAEGQARLRLFQHEAPLSAQLDLPITPITSDMSTRTIREGDLDFQNQVVVDIDHGAFVRVEVSIESSSSDDAAKKSDNGTSSNEASSSMDDRIPSLTAASDASDNNSKKEHQQDEDDEDIPALFAQFKSGARNMGRGDGTSSPLNAPEGNGGNIDNRNDMNKDVGDEENHRRGLFSSILCSSELQLRPYLQGFVDLLQRCEGRSNHNKDHWKFYSSYADQSRDMDVTPSLAASTIATRESLNI